MQRSSPRTSPRQSPRSAPNAVIGGLTLPRTNLAMLIRRDPATGELLPDSIGLSAAELWAALPVKHRSIYLVDETNMRSAEDIITNIEASEYLNDGGGLAGSAKGYSNHQIGTTAAIMRATHRYHRQPVATFETEMIDTLEMLDALEVII